MIDLENSFKRIFEIHSKASFLNDPKVLIKYMNDEKMDRPLIKMAETIVEINQDRLIDSMTCHDEEIRQYAQLIAFDCFLNEAMVYDFLDSLHCAINHGLRTKKMDHPTHGCCRCTLDERVYFSEDMSTLIEANCSTLDIPSTVHKIGREAFKHSILLTDVKIPESVEIIGKDSFRGCISLTEITLPKYLRVIERGAFANCRSLKQIRIPDSIRTIEEGAFYGCDNLSFVLYEVEGARKEPNRYSVRDNCILEYDETTHLYSILVTGYGIINDGSCLIPEYVSKIGKMAFSGSNALTSLLVPDTVEEISAESFSFCRNLCAVFLNNVVEEIEDKMFAGCTSLTVVLFSPNVKKIGRKAFWGCTSLFQLYIPNSIQYIGSDTFERCSNLHIRIGEKGVSLNKRYSTRDGALMMNFTNSEIGNILMVGYSLVRSGSCIIPEYVSSISNEAFQYSNDLRELIIPDHVHTVGQDAFKGCDKLWVAIIPEKMNDDVKFPDPTKVIFRPSVIKKNNQK